MSGDCQGTITQSMDGEIAVATTPAQCIGCLEDGCPGKEGLELPAYNPDDARKSISEPDGPQRNGSPYAGYD